MLDNKFCVKIVIYHPNHYISRVNPLLSFPDSNIPAIELSEEEEDDVDVIYHDLESLNEHLVVIKSFRPHYRTEGPELDDEGSYTNGKITSVYNYSVYQHC